MARVEEAWRKLAGTAFLQPPPVQSVRYAIMEGAEADDANMREERSTDARNNDRNMDARKEWGQAGFMLLTAIVQVKAAGGGQVLAENYPAFQQSPAWLYGAYMGCLPTSCKRLPRITRLPIRPIAGLCVALLAAICGAAGLASCGSDR